MCREKTKQAITASGGRQYIKHVLVIRLSALGDVAILQPILESRAKANPDTLFTLAAPGILEPLFSHIPNVVFKGVRKKQSVLSLYRQLAEVRPTIVADMHCVNRVIGACLLMRLHGIKVYSIRKERRKRRQLTRQCHKRTAPLKPSWQLYNEVFDRCGLAKGALDTSTIAPRHRLATAPRTIAIAPFAQHKGKIWREEHITSLIRLLAADQRNNIALLGSKSESATLERWCDGLANVRCVAGKLKFQEELELISKADVMVSMDSANMHFASCLGVPVVSIWGATHRNGGFYGWRQDTGWAVESDLPCRPCSMYGNKACRFGDYRCLEQITPKMVCERIEEILKWQERMPENP